MGSSTNRSLQAKYKKSLVQRQALAMVEYAKPAYLSNKTALRKLHADCQLMVKPAARPIIDSVDIVYAVYNPRIYRAPKPAVWAAYVDCDNELIRR